MSFRIGIGSALLLFLGCTSGRGDSGSPPPARSIPSPQALVSAHQAYLDGDFVALGEHVRDVLVDTSAGPLVKENALALLDKAYEVRKGVLPSRFTLPAGYDGFQYGVMRNGLHYQVHARLLARDAKHLTGFTVRRSPGDVLLLDKATGKGHFEIRHDPGTATEPADEIVLDSGEVDAAPDDGVVSFRLSFDDGTISEGFVIAHGLSTNAAPEVTSPVESESIAEATPVVRWEPFRSDRGVAFERARMVFHVVQGEDTVVWSAAVSPDAREVRIGRSGDPMNVSLRPGNYRLAVTSVESRMFGPVEVVRASRAFRPFHVVGK